ncbi:MAG TPA: hypothetical protein VNG31_10425 [Candidatus Baltobacteraceae bacterium]|nr:hypothetical protein [Candidatus Baltobacteraceae bacterium]
MDAIDSVVLHFFVANDGELRCRATDVYSRRTWMVPSARAIRELLHSEHEPEKKEARDEH